MSYPLPWKNRLHFRVGFVKGIVRPTPPKTELAGPAKLPVGAEAATEEGVQTRPPWPRRAPRFLPRSGRVKTHGSESEAVWEGSVGGRGSVGAQWLGCKFRLRPDSQPGSTTRHWACVLTDSFLIKTWHPQLEAGNGSMAPLNNLATRGNITTEAGLILPNAQTFASKQGPTQSSPWTCPSKEWDGGAGARTSNILSLMNRL